MVTIENAVSLSLGGMLGYFLRLFIEHRLSKSRSREDRKESIFTSAVLEYRRALITELSGLYPEVTEPLNFIAPKLANALPKIQIAVSAFSFHLNKEKAAQLQATFNAFREDATSEIPRLCSTAEIMFGKDTVLRAVTLLHQRINELLSYAA